MRRFLLFSVSLLFIACGQNTPEESKPSPSSINSSGVASAERQKQKKDRRDTLWHWEARSTTPAFLFANSDSANTWELEPISAENFVRHQAHYRALKLFRHPATEWLKDSAFFLATKPYFIAYDSRVQNPNWVSKEWAYFYFGYAPQLKLYSAARSRIVGQGLLIDSLSGIEVVLNSNYDNSWEAILPAPGKNRFLLYANDLYAGEGFSLLSVDISRPADSLQLRKTGQVSSSKYFIQDIIWLNRDTWAVHCLEFDPNMYPDRGAPEEFYFKSKQL